MGLHRDISEEEQTDPEKGKREEPAQRACGGRSSARVGQQGKDEEGRPQPEVPPLRPKEDSPAREEDDVELYGEAEGKNALGP